MFLQRYFVICSLLFLISCEEEVLHTDLTQGSWKWVESFSFGGITGRRTRTTPAEAGHDQYMVITSSDTITHFRNDTLEAYSIIKSMRASNSEVVIEHAFLDSMETNNGYEVVQLRKETITYRNDSLRTVSAPDYIQGTSLYRRDH